LKRLADPDPSALAMNRKRVLRNFAVLLLIAALIQIWIASMHDTMGDVLYYRDWCRALTMDGLIPSYSAHPVLQSRGTGIDYPPVYPYMLLGLGKILNSFSPEMFQHNDRFVETSIKILSVFANLIISVLLFFALMRRGKPQTAFLAAGAYAFNPALILNTAYWGQSESVSSLFAILSVLMLDREKPEWAWALIVTGIFVKPLVLPLAPLIVLATLKNFPLKRFWSSVLSGVATLIAIFLPFITVGKISLILSMLWPQVEAMPYLSVNAHNFWWIVQGGRPWVTTNSVISDGLTYNTAALLILGAFYVISLTKFWRSRYEHALFVAAAEISFGFFMLYTHMHENHLFPFFPLFSLFCFESSAYKKIYVVLTLTFFANMALHDPFLNHVLAPHATGPSLNLPAVSKSDLPIYRTLESEGKGHVVEEITGNISLFRLLLTIVNSQINCVVFLYWLVLFYRGPNFEPLDVIPESERRFFVTGTALIIAASIIRLVVKLLNLRSL
jgi:Gpi18-like mannosyltransferase